ncbi:MAG: tetratricopeptide repeat protein [Bacteroidota bacterium]
MTKYIINIIFLILLLTFNSCNIFKKSAKTTTDKNIKSEAGDLKFDYAFMEGNKHKMLGNYADAAAYYSKCIQLNKKSAASMYELANIYISQGDMITAQSLVEEAVKINPDNIWYQLLLAALYEKNNQVEKAMTIYKNMVKKYPGKIDLKLDYADLLSSEKKYNESIKIYNDLETQIGVNEELSLAKERLYMILDEKEKAYDELNKLIELFPYEPRYYGLLAEIYVSNKLYDKALEIYTKLLQIDPNNGLAHLSISEYYRITDQPDKSFDELKIAFKSSDVSLDLKVKMILTYYTSSKKGTKNSEQAYELLEIFEKKHPEEPKAIAVYGDFLIKDEKYKEAREKYKRVTELVKNNYLIWEQLLFIESRLNRFKDMYDESKEALEYFPSQSNLYLFFGIAATRQKDYDEAIKSLLIGTELSEDNKQLKGQFYTYLAEAYNKKQEHENSDKYFDKVLELDPDDKYVLNNYSYFLSLRNEKLDKALEMTQKCNSLEPDNSTFLDTYAWVLYKRKEYEKALEIINKSLEHGGKGSALIMEHYGDILYQKGDKEKAKEVWINACGLGKGSEFLKQKSEEGILIE